MQQCIRVAIPQFLTRHRKGQAIVQLGRYGDIIMMLPVAKHLADEYKSPIPWFVAKDYASVLEGVSYVKPHVFDGSWEDLSKATAIARRTHHKLLIPRNWGASSGRYCFHKAAWHAVGYLNHWGKLPMVFDARNFERESRLAAQLFSRSKPNILVNLHGFSAPFSHANEVLALIRSFDWNVIDLSLFKCHRLYDLVGLMDQAHLLVTIDTSTLHLAYASTVSMLAFLRGPESMFDAAIPPATCDKSFFYSDVPTSMERIAQALSAFDSRFHTPIWHVTNSYPSTGDAKRREDVANLTWRYLYDNDPNVKPVVITESSYPRNGLSVGDAAPVPFIKDVIDAGVSGAAMDDIVAFTNTDSCLLPHTAIVVRREVARYGCFYSHRIDLPRVDGPLESWQIGGKRYPGADLFAFTKKWWVEHRNDIPDLLMGREGWDHVMKRIMQGSGFRPRDTVVYHEAHFSNWIKDIDKPGNVYNRTLCTSWAVSHGFTRDLQRNNQFLFAEC